MGRRISAEEHERRVQMAKDGLSLTEAAARSGIAASTMVSWAQRYRVVFDDARRSPARAERAAERMRKLNQDGRMVQKHLRDLTPAQLADYRLLTRNGFAKDEALAIIKNASGAA